MSKLNKLKINTLYFNSFYFVVKFFQHLLRTKLISSGLHFIMEDKKWKNCYDHIGNWCLEILQSV